MFDFSLVNTISRSPSVVRMPTSGIDSRIDAYPNNVCFLEPLKKLQAWGDGNVRLLNTMAKFVKCGPFGSNLLAEGYVDEGVCVIRPFNIDQLSLSINDLAFISENECTANGLHLYNSGCLVFARVGNIAVGRIPKRNYKYTISPNIIIAELKDSYNPDFVCAFLSSKYGNCQLERALKIVAQPTISTDTVRNLLVPLPDALIQEYIGCKVELAEKCRERATSCESTAGTIFEKRWTPSDVALSGSFTTITSSRILDTDRLDSEFYRTDLLLMREKVVKNESGYVRVGEYGESFSGKTPSDKGDDDSLCEIVRVANLTSRGLNWSNRLFGTISKSEKGFLKDGDIIVCKDAHQKYYIGQQVDIYCRPNHHAVASSETLVIRFKREHINPFAALIYLRSKEGYAAFQQQIRGTSAHLYPTDVENIVVPKIPDDAEEQIEQLIRRAEHCRIRAYALTDEAKSDVEAFIEGKLDTEAILSGKLKAPTWADIEIELEVI